jgi:hypothetical protein
VECKGKILLHERLVEDPIAVKGKINHSNRVQMPQLRSMELSGKIHFFEDLGKQLDCRNSGRHMYPIELSKSSVKTTESNPTVSGILIENK